MYYILSFSIVSAIIAWIFMSSNSPRPFISLLIFQFDIINLTNIIIRPIWPTWKSIQLEKYYIRNKGMKRMTCSHVQHKKNQNRKIDGKPPFYLFASLNHFSPFSFWYVHIHTQHNICIHILYYCIYVLNRVRSEVGVSNWAHLFQIYFTYKRCVLLLLLLRFANFSCLTWVVSIICIPFEFIVYHCVVHVIIIIVIDRNQYVNGDRSPRKTKQTESKTTGILVNHLVKITKKNSTK